MQRRSARAALAAVLVSLALGLQSWGSASRTTTPPPPPFAASIERLSEPGGDFDTDNLISNERSYLHVMPALLQRGVKGGAYVGVGPDQNFSYIAQVRPTIAFMLDVRRDNLLLHLLFKALFSLARTRVEYLSLLTGRPVPEPIDAWRDATIERIVAYIDEEKPNADAVATLRGRTDETIRTFGVPLSEGDFQTIDRFHRTFIESGLSLKFSTLGQQPRGYYPTYRELLLETDRDGRQANYLASEPQFQFVQSLENRNLIIPVVGDLSGPHALRAIADLMAERGERLSAFYVSNVELYLFRQGRFSQFVDNLDRLPRTGRSVVIRSVFGGGFGGMRYQSLDVVPGYDSASVVQSATELVVEFANGKYRSYRDLVDASARSRDDHRIPAADSVR